MIDVKVLRTDPDRVTASQRARGESETLVDEAAGGRRHAPLGDRRSSRSCGPSRRSSASSIPRRSGEERPALLERTKELADQVKKAEADPERATRHLRRDCSRTCGNLVVDGVPAGGEDDYVVLVETRGTPRDFAAEGFAPRTISSSAAARARSTSSAAPRSPGSRFYFLTGQGAELELALLNLAMSTALGNGFTPMIPPALVKPRGDGGHRFPRPGGAGRLPPGAATISTWSAPPRCRWPRTTPTRS